MSSFEERKLAALAALVNSSSDKSPKGGLDAPIADDVEWLNSQENVFTTSSCSGRVSLYQHAAGVSKGGRWLLVHHEQASASQVEAALETATGGGDVVLRLEPFILTAECRTVQAALALVRTALAAGFRESGVCGAQRRAVLTLRSSLRLEVPVVWRGVRLVGPDALAALVAIANEKFAENERRTARLFAALRLAALSPDNDTQAPPRAAAARRSLCCRACGLLGHKAALCPAPPKQRGLPPPHELVQPTPSLQQQLVARQELILARICATEREEASRKLRSAQPQAEAPHEAHPPALRVPVASAKAWKDALSCAGALDRRCRVGHDGDGAAVVLPVLPSSLPAIADLLSRAARQGCCLVHMPRQQRPVPSQQHLRGAAPSQPESAMLSAPRAAFLALTSPLGCGPDGALVTDVSALGPASLGCPRERVRLAALVHPHETVVDLQAGCGAYAMAALTGGNACKVIACEHRPMALACLRAALDRCGGTAAARCVVCPGDARANGVLPQPGIAHRVLAPDRGSSWLATALSTLHPSRGGTLHLRVASAADAAAPDALTARLRAAATQLGLRWAVRFAAAGQPLSVCDAFHAVLDFTCEPMLPADAVPLCWPPPRPMRRISCPDRTTFVADVIALHAPALLTEYPVGSACSAWTLEAIQGGSAGAASVHVSSSRSIDLAGHRVANTRGNFSFQELPFGEAVARMAGLPDRVGAAFPPLLCPGERMYLRSTAGAQASHFPALYPSLASHLPLFADGCGGGLFDRQSYHSSVLRLSSADTHLRTHFDTADNVLIQICGTKTVTLWPPSQAHNLYCQGSSSRVHPDAMGGSPSALAREWPRAVAAMAHRTEVRLRPGEALFIPALWFHSVTSETFSASVNVFFRGGLARELSDERDVYGNKDPPLALLAAAQVKAASQALRELPQPYRSFYARRAAEPLLALTEDSFTDV